MFVNTARSKLATLNWTVDLIIVPKQFSFDTMRRIRYQKKPVAYYSNSIATRRFLLSGDVEENPSTLKEQCNKNKQSKPLLYDLCHAKCTN